MGTLTITTTSAQDARLAPAFGRLLGTTDSQGNIRNATAAEVRAAIINHIRTIVFTYEQQRAVELTTLQPLDLT